MPLQNYYISFLQISLLTILTCPFTQPLMGQELFSPIGDYELTTRVLGMEESLQISMEVTRLEDDYIATVTTDFAPEISRTVGIQVSGRQLSYQAATPNGSLTITVTVDEYYTVEGTWALGLLLRGQLTGRKLAEDPFES